MLAKEMEVGDAWMDQEGRPVWKAIGIRVEDRDLVVDIEYFSDRPQLPTGSVRKFELAGTTQYPMMRSQYPMLHSQRASH